MDCRGGSLAIRFRMRRRLCVRVTVGKHPVTVHQFLIKAEHVTREQTCAPIIPAELQVLLVCRATKAGTPAPGPTAFGDGKMYKCSDFGVKKSRTRMPYKRSLGIGIYFASNQKPRKFC